MNVIHTLNNAKSAEKLTSSTSTLASTTTTTATQTTDKIGITSMNLAAYMYAEIKKRYLNICMQMMPSGTEINPGEGVTF